MQEQLASLIHSYFLHKERNRYLLTILVQHLLTIPIIWFCFGITSAPLQSQGATTYYASPSGDDGNPGTEEQPFRTIQAAVNRAQAGDTVYIREGTYNENFRINNSGTSSNSLRVAAYPGETPIVDGNYELPSVPSNGGGRCNNTVSPPRCHNYEPLVDIQGDYVILEGLDIRHSSGRGVRVYREDGPPRGVIIRGNKVHDVRYTGIYLHYVEDVLVENNDVWHAIDYATHSRSASSLDWGMGILAWGSNNITYRGNRIFNNWGEGASTGLNSSNVTIEDNIIYDNYALQLYIHRSHDIDVQRNLIYCTNDSRFHRGGNPSAGLVINNEGQFDGSKVVTNATINNNVIVGCRTNFSIWESDYPVKNVDITRNTFVNAATNSGSGTGVSLSTAGYNNVRFANNIIYQENGRIASAVSHSGLTYSSNFWSQNPPSNASTSGDIVGDPQLNNPSAALSPGQVEIEWYVPHSSSPAIDANMGATGENENSNQPLPTVTPISEDTPSQTTTVPPQSPITPTQEPISAETPTPTQPDEGNTGDPNIPDYLQPVALYHFDEAGGNTLRDVSGVGTPIDLEIEQMDSVQWLDKGLTIVEPVVIRSKSPTSKLSDRCNSAQALSIAAWIKPANANQDGPARIVSLSQDTSNRNFTLGQGAWGERPTDVFNMRLRTSKTDNNGEPSLTSERGLSLGEPTHLAYSHDASGNGTLYVNAQNVGTTNSGTIARWDSSYSLLLANENDGQRPWLGTIYEVAIYCQALTAQDIEAYYNQTVNQPGLPPENLRESPPDEDTPPGDEPLPNVEPTPEAEPTSEVEQPSLDIQRTLFLPFVGV